ncbi:MAG: 4Fe-4S binding protein [Oscillospiraceae bacterium]|nr:4Fe-4S binding protein [Oscillospiraceae bacterium]
MAYKIKDNCIACGACAESCPVQCINSGDIYVISPEECIDCGTCKSVCPVDAPEQQ